MTLFINTLCDRAGTPARAFLRGIVGGALLTVALTACSGRDDAAGTAEQPTGPVAPVVVSVTGSAPSRTPPSVLTPAPAAGTVRIEPGPFTDRLDITNASLSSGEQPAVTATVQNTVDVSEFIVLELQADFYDASGGYLGSGSATYADEEFATAGVTPLTHGTGDHSDAIPVTVPSHTALTGAVSAVLTVPQLVNE